MKYLIIGAGATGGCIGGYLAKIGCDVTLIARGAHLEAIKKNGLTIEEYSESFTTYPKACEAEDYNDTPDVVFVCVKYYSIDSIMPLLKRVCGKNTVVIPILNVFGTGAVIQEKLPDITVLDGCIYIYSLIKEAGVISQPSATFIFRVFFGYRKGQPVTNEETALRAEADLRKAGIDAALTDTIEKDALLKFSMVSPMGACVLYHNARAGAIKVPGEVRNTYISLIREIEKLGNAMGITYDEDIVERNLKIEEGMPDDSTTSMHRDILNGGYSEINGLVHRVTELAEKYNVELPLYEKISRWAKERNIR